jgi:hypothetical protein
MTETTRAPRPKQDEHHDAPQAAHTALRRAARGSWIVGLLCAAVIGGISSKSEAEPTGTPTENSVFFDCTFDASVLQSILEIETADLAMLNNGTLQASYIIIYVTSNPNDGQNLTVTPPPNPPKFTGPILCTNDLTDDITPTTADTLIPPTPVPAPVPPDTGPTVDILGAEEVSHLQYRPTGGDDAETEKRVCHTVASKTECFLIQPKSPPPPLE